MPLKLYEFWGDKLMAAEDKPHARRIFIADIVGSEAEARRDPPHFRLVTDPVKACDQGEPDDLVDMDPYELAELCGPGEIPSM